MSTLESIREHSRGWLAGILVAIIIVPFALWGVNSYFTGGPEINVATINGEPVSQVQFRQLLAQEKRSFQAMLGNNFRPDMFDTPAAKQAVLDKLINEQLLTEHAIDLKHRVSDEELLDTIRSVDAFKSSGRFDQERYKQQLRSQNYSSAQFEAQLRQDLLKDQINRSLANSLIGDQFDHSAFTTLINQQRDIRYAILERNQFSDRVSVTDEEIEAYYNEHAGNYQTTPKVAVLYIELRLDDIASRIDVSESELQTAYEENLDRFITPEKRRARHILLERSETNEQATNELAQDIASKLSSGESFAALAKEYSADLATAKSDGDLGYVARGTLDPVFESALFELQPGEVSEPIVTSFGVHIIEVTDIQSKAVQTLDEVREPLTRQIQANKAETRYVEQAENMQRLVFENPTTLEVAADALNLPIKETEFFGMSGGSGILSEPAFVSTAFSEQVVQEQFNSETFELADGRYVALRLKEYKSAEAIPLAAAKSEIKLLLLERKLTQTIQTEGQQLLATIDQSSDVLTTVEEISKSYGLDWQKADTVSRIDPAPTVSPEIIDKAFTMPAPPKDSSKSGIFGGVRLQSGDFAIVQLLSVHSGANATETKDPQLTQQLLRMRLESEVSSYLQALRNQADITLFPENL